MVARSDSHQRMLFEFEPKCDLAKAKALRKGDKYFYVFFIGTRLDCRGKGLATQLLKHYQTIATAAGLPIWLEATTAKSKPIYEKVGFEVVEEMVLGKRKARSDGTACAKGEEGEGVKIWAMIWRPEGPMKVKSGS